MLPIVMEKRLVLNSWKEIADYMGRGVRTVQRYERDLKLPVHRPAGKSRSAVIAFADEIERWMRQGPVRAHQNRNAPRAAATIRSEWERLLANSHLLLKRADALKTHTEQLVLLMREAEKRHQLMLDRMAPGHFSETLAKRTEALNAKITELSGLAPTARDKAHIHNALVPAAHKIVNGHKDALPKH